MRKWFWRIHSIVGLVSGLVLIVIGITGSLLVFHKEISSLLHPEKTRVEPTDAGRLSFDELLAAVEDALPGYAITGWDPSREDPRAADGAFVIPFGTYRWHYITVDPYRGEVLSHPTDYAATFTGWMLELHYALFLGTFGRAIAGIAGVALCFLGVSGLWLYRRFWKNFFRLRWKASARMLSSDIHRLTGVLSVVFNLVLGFTGAYWNIDHVMHELSGHHHEDENAIPGKLYPENFALDAIIADAAERLPGFQTNYISLPWAVDGPVTLWGRFVDAPWFRSPHGSQVAYASQTGEFTSLHDLREDPLWPQVLDAFEPLHFGNFGGLPIQIIWALAGLAPGVLAISGMVIWWKRQKPRPGRSGRPFRA